MATEFSSHHLRETRIESVALLWAAVLHIILPANDPNAAGAPPADESVEVDIESQPLPAPVPSPSSPSELQQLPPLQQTGGNRGDKSDEQLSEDNEELQSKKDNEELQSKKEIIERLMKGFTVSVSSSAMIAIFTYYGIHPDSKQIVLLRVSVVLFFGSLLTGLIIPLLNDLSRTFSLWFFKSVELATYLLLLLASLTVGIHFMGMDVLFTLALVFTVLMVIYYTGVKWMKKKKGD